MTTDDDELWLEFGEDAVEVFAAIYEATCADCLDPDPHHLCCSAFYCREHYLFHEKLRHG